ncbi:2,3-dihydro-2,3-dihydroxybenzoate dehydrogenase [Prauserella oleivorans]|uniref:2,3-dihydro-2,3-dihydroxybenzoate dehydrogenase n=1 Tax=Prauserella oleivorans TaxID=1478153 RepID=A0ABW5WF18_9PSEU
MDQQGIAGKVAFVTGAGQGIGEAVVRALRAGGVTVAAVDRSAEVQAKYADDRGITGFVADVTDSARVADVVSEVEHSLGAIDILANVAGVLRTGPVADYADEDWAHTFGVNTTGVFTVSREVTRRMIPRRRGCVVTVSSNAAGVPRHGMAAYAASKAAATMFTKCLGLELAGYGIRCNVVAPGSTDTPMQRAMWTDAGADPVLRGDLDTYRVGIPLGRIADPEDVAAAVVFLASDQARHITMHDLYVDGGATLRA